MQCNARQESPPPPPLPLHLRLHPSSNSNSNSNSVLLFLRRCFLGIMLPSISHPRPASRLSRIFSSAAPLPATAFGSSTRIHPVPFIYNQYIRTTTTIPSIDVLVLPLPHLISYSNFILTFF
ncbi:hypothetical protein L207DRAFT_1645 [Hyaloscypha variabilis F]|uniref:Uncharacterized protein n=1 Tax=Hyaloscypha variabilis (strain UAMH 11265 / GT02V1 / F) TaxID=1149755 RepID=A0A2J6SBJ9_HYAVF|nr:hypothetical protein L207DRAFT_1645 [Hyaloscypha variabilis F]